MAKHGNINIIRSIAHQKFTRRIFFPRFFLPHVFLSISFCSLNVSPTIEKKRRESEYIRPAFVVVVVVGLGWWHRGGVNTCLSTKENSEAAEKMRIDNPFNDRAKIRIETVVTIVVSHSE